jgi:DNA polymerase III epsilon subunit family exonuclease
VRAAARRGEPFLDALRRVARAAHGDQDGRWLWRFIYQVENLRAVAQGQESLGGLVAELLGERMGKYRNPLDERLGELVDPSRSPGATELAAALRATNQAGGTVWIAPWHGLEIGLRGLLVASEAVRAVRFLEDDDEPGPGEKDLVLRPDAVDPGALVVRLFKALQLEHVHEPTEPFPAYVSFDLETTGTDVNTCEIVEIGAALVEGGVVVDTFHSLVRPDGSVPAAATEVHGYGDADLAGAPRFAEVWPRFRAFIGDRVLVAHNGQAFDIPVLRRLSGAADLLFFDTLPLARALSDESAKLEALAERFAVPLARAHHALDDAVALAGVFAALWREKQRRSRTTALVNLLDFLGLALALAADPGTDPERRALLDVSRVYALGRYSNCLAYYANERERTGRVAAPTRDEVVERLGGRRLLERLRAERSPAERYPSAVARLEALVEASSAETLAAGIRRLLERVALSTSEGVEVDPDRVNLLTLHSTKGLEFSRVYVVGVEDEQLPGGRELDRSATRDIEEARRVLYVGMTRAMDRLVLTRADTRFGKPGRGSLFLEEMGLAS